MTAVGGLVLVLGLLVSARCEVRARDPEVEEDEERGRGGAGGGGGGVEGFPPHPERLHRRATQTPPLGERGNYPPARSGNWCAFVQRRVVTKVVVCGSENYVMRSQSPCPSGAPDCQLPMYKLAWRPLYKQLQEIQSALLWRCCPGHDGPNCEDTASDTQMDSASSDLIGGSGPVTTELHVPGEQLQRGDPHREQNDHQAPYDTGDPDSPHTTPPPALHQDHRRHHAAHGHHTTPPPALHRDHRRHHAAHGHHTTPPPALHRDHGRHHAVHAAGSMHDHQHHLHHGQQERRLPDAVTLPDAPDATLPYPDTARSYPDTNAHSYPDANARSYPDTALPYPDTALPYPDTNAHSYPDAPAGLPAPDMMALVMSLLQPVLQGFNRSLEHLSRQVGELAQDVAQLKSSRPGAEPQPQPPPPVLPDHAEAADERLDARLEEAFEHVREVQRQLEGQRRDMEIMLHSQHAMLHYNLTSFKMDVDVKLKRHQKMLQVSLQAMNATLMELNQNQDQDQDQHQDQDQDHDQDRTAEELAPLPDTAALWEAVERLDNMVVNNTVKVEGLAEDAEVTAGSVQLLLRDIKHLEKLINVTARTSQVQFMETGLEVEAAREAVLRRVGELAGNLSVHVERLADTDSDVDDLFVDFHNVSAVCNCATLWATVASLERGVANVTAMANENRAALYEDEDGGAGQWAGGGDWEPAVEALQRGLQQVRESVASVASEQSGGWSLDQRLTQLSSLLAAVQVNVSGLTEADRKQRDEMQRLAASFRSLLTDAVRHSDVLEILLGEEVLEFLDWPVQDQEAHSIPALKETLRGHEQNIKALMDRHTGDRVELPSADQPPPSSSLLSDGWRPADGGAARERQRLLQADGGDLWNLEKTVEELKTKVLRLETAAPDAALQAEVTWLKRGLEEHLRTFKNVFSNADVLAASAATLELDKLWQLLQSRDEKKEKKKGGKRRSRRETTGVAPVPSSQSGASLLLAAGGDAQRRRRGWH